MIYSYQNHQRNLRGRQQTEHLQEAAVEPDVIDAPAENNEPQQMANVGQNQQRESESTPLINQDTENSTTPSAPSAEQDENARLPTLTLVRTFILSFFSSLIPETPAV